MRLNKVEVCEKGVERGELQLLGGRTMGREKRGVERKVGVGGCKDLPS